MKRSPAAAVWLSLIPGAGHIYVGQVTKGIVLIVILGSVIQAVSNGADGFGITIPFIWLYAMLDAHRAAVEANRRAASGRELPVGQDAPAKWWGYALIVLGVLFLLESMDLIAFDWVWKLWPLGLIGLGIYVLRKKSAPSPLPAGSSYPPPPSPPDPEKFEEPEPAAPAPMPMPMTDEERGNG